MSKLVIILGEHLLLEDTASASCLSHQALEALSRLSNAGYRLVLVHSNNDEAQQQHQRLADIREQLARVGGFLSAFCEQNTNTDTAETLQKIAQRFSVPAIQTLVIEQAASASLTLRMGLVDDDSSVILTCDNLLHATELLLNNENLSS